MDDAEMEKRFADHNRRFSDKLRDCKQEMNMELGAIGTAVTTMQADLKEMKEILEAWNNMKGFASSMRFFSTVLKMSIPIVVFIGGIYWFAKTGRWPQ